MVRQFQILLVLLCSSAHLMGQQRSLVSLNWDNPKFRELDYSHTLSKAKNFSESSKSALIAAIAARLSPKMAEFEIANEQELHKISERSRFELVDLNKDGRAEIIVQPVGLKAGCGATGNCPLWIFAASPKAYRLLAEIEGVQMYRAEDSGNQGYADVAFASHDSASEKHIYIYRYSNGTYRSVACYDAWWTEARVGTWKPSSRPSITPCRIGRPR
jgi:hypothetical protein